MKPARKIAKSDGVRQYSIEQFMLTERMSGIAFAPDESEILVTSNRSGVFNAFSIRIDDGASRQLTFSTDETIRALAYFPNDRRIVYVRDKGGFENLHLCVLAEDGRETELTRGAHVKSCLVGWSEGGRWIYYGSDERTHTYLDLYRVDAMSYARELIFHNDDGFNLVGVSPLGDYASLVKYHGLTDSNLYLYHIGSKTLKLITPHDGDVRYLPLHFDSESSSLYYSAMKSDDEVIEYRYDLEQETHEECGRRPANFRQIVMSESRRFRAVITDERESSSIALTDCVSNTAIPLRGVPAGNVTSAAISRSDRWLAFYVNGDRDPTELYVYDLSTHQLSRLTNNVNPAIDREDLVESEVLSFESFDGTRIPCLLWKPHHASSIRRVPALVWVHGGPIGQTRKGYAGAVQFLVNHGYAILAVNHRGSTGYGKAFMDAADGKQGREPLWDCIEAKHFLAGFDFIDSERIGIIGGSFGGYMTLAALTFHPEEFVAGVAICGVSNLVRHVEARIRKPYAAPIYLQKVGDPVKDRVKLEAASPALHAKRITKPLMVLHGAKDPRASKIESDDIVNAVRANGGIVEYVEFDDEAHGFRKRANSVTAYQAVLTFLDRYLSARHEPALHESG